MHSQEDDYDGVAVVTYGPIVLEPTLKLTLEGLLSAGGSKFSVSLMQDNSKIIRDCSLMLTSDYIRVVLNNSNEKSLKIRYNLDSPEIEMNYLDTKKIALIFKNEKYLSFFYQQKHLKYSRNKINNKKKSEKKLKK